MKKVIIYVSIGVVTLFSLAVGGFYLADYLEQEFSKVESKARLSGKKSEALSLAIELEMKCAEFPDRYDSCDFTKTAKAQCKSNIDDCQSYIQELKQMIKNSDVENR